MIKLNLGDDKIALLDDCDAHLININKTKWYFIKGRNKHTGYVSKTVYNGKPRKTVYLHHAILGYPLKKLQVDHINGNGLDNRRENLRFVIQRQNQQNQYKHRNGTRKYPGVLFNKKTKKWSAQIRNDNNRYYLGTFKTEEEAGEAYRKATAKFT